VNNVETYVIVTIGESPTEISANLQGPIMINTENNLAKQLVLVNSEYKIKFPLMSQTPVGETAKAAPTRENEMAGV
jgi:flagellar assembly factor FliW